MRLFSKIGLLAVLVLAVLLVAALDAQAGIRQRIAARREARSGSCGSCSQAPAFNAQGHFLGTATCPPGGCRPCDAQGRVLPPQGGLQVCPDGKCPLKK